MNLTPRFSHLIMGGDKYAKHHAAHKINFYIKFSLVNPQKIYWLNNYKKNSIFAQCWITFAHQ